MIHDRQVRFFDPHPGLKGCPTPLPEAICLVANAMNGTQGTLSEGVSLLRSVVKNGIFHDCPTRRYARMPGMGDGFLGFKIERPDGAIDSWRVIRYTFVPDAEVIHEPTEPRTG